MSSLLRINNEKINNVENNYNVYYHLFRNDTIRVILNLIIVMLLVNVALPMNENISNVLKYNYFVKAVVVFLYIGILSIGIKKEDLWISFLGFVVIMIILYLVQADKSEVSDVNYMQPVRNNKDFVEVEKLMLWILSQGGHIGGIVPTGNTIPPEVSKAVNAYNRLMSGYYINGVEYVKPLRDYLMFTSGRVRKYNNSDLPKSFDKDSILDVLTRVTTDGGDNQKEYNSYPRVIYLDSNYYGSTTVYPSVPFIYYTADGLDSRVAKRIVPAAPTNTTIQFSNFVNVGIA